SDGKWSYELDNTNPAVNGLNTSQTLIDTFKVYTVDGTEQIVTVTINGATDVVNQTPTDIIWTALDPNSNFPSRGETVANLATVDPDNSGSYTYRLISSIGNFSVSSSGVVTTNFSFQQNEEYSLTIEVRDALGGTYSETFKIITGGSGWDFTTASNSFDTIVYGDGNWDTLTGGAKDDTLFGQASGDELTGGAGADTLYGGTSSDTLNGDQADRLLNGGDSYDTLRVAAGFTSRSDAQIDKVEAVVLTSSGILNLSNQTEGFAIDGTSNGDAITGGSGDDNVWGFGGGDVIRGGAGNDEISGGSGVDALHGDAGRDSLYGGDDADNLYGDSDDIVLDGGDGRDTLNVAGGFVSSSDNQIDDIEDVIMSSGGLLNLGNQEEDLSISGSASADTITGGRGDDIINGQGGDDTIYGGRGNDQIYGTSTDILLDGGTGTNTLVVEDDFTSRDNQQLVNLQKVVMTGNASVLNLSNQTEGFGVDIYADSANRAWNVTLGTTPNAKDVISFSHDTIGSTDQTVVTVRNFQTGSDKIDVLLGGADITTRFVETGTSTSGTNLSGWASGTVIEIMGTSRTASDLTDDDTTSDVRNAIGAAIRSLDAGTYTVIVYSNGTTTANAGIYSVVVPTSRSDLSSSQFSIEHVMTLNSVGYGTLSGANFSDLADPIILDLDKNGFAFSSIDNGVNFDIDADGNKDQIAWTSDDGILAYDANGNGTIDDGTEIFTPDFNGGTFASGVAALASLDLNRDGKIDGGDVAFKDLKIWIDANNNGISDEGELSTLSDHGVTSISLAADQSGGTEDGQVIFAEGEFTFADGSTGNFVEVGFDTIFGSETDGLTLHGGMGEVVMTGTTGADTFVFDGDALDELDVADVITDFSSEEGDVLDVTALLDSLLGEQSGATVDTHLRATLDGAGNTTVSVQAEPGVWKDVVELQNHDTAIKVLFDDKHATITPHD
ncbi:MAG: VCBS domain-containing protein, partial [Rhizobium sp.]|nr:VCBS domain-containing protein [Rhizobium sp.]